jgi:hypothetical protein
METINASFRVTIGRETRWIECSTYAYENHDGQDRFTSVMPVAMAKVGRTGTKLWPSRIMVWRDKKPNADGVYGYRAGMNTVHLNRQAMIVDWNRPELARYASKHNSAYYVAQEDAAR